VTEGGKRPHKEEEDDGAEGPLRRCIVTGDVQSPAGMIRFVTGPESIVVPDVANKLPGRGYWVTSRRELIVRAMEKGLFAKAARCAVKFPPDLPEQVERLLVKRCIEHLGLTRRAGQAVIGYMQVEEIFKDRAGRIAALVEASGSGAADRGKLIGYAKRRGGVAVVGCLSESEIGLAFGRENVVHAALTQGPLAAKFVAEAERLGGFRVLCPPEWDAAS